MSLYVQKFGGTSVADIDCIKRVARRVKRTCRQGHQVVVVVSARAGVTNDLVSRAAAITAGTFSFNQFSVVFVYQLFVIFWGFFFHCNQYFFAKLAGYFVLVFRR